jgi:hypothetical protein
MIPPVAVKPDAVGAPGGAALTASVPVLENTSRYAANGLF